MVLSTLFCSLPVFYSFHFVTVVIPITLFSYVRANIVSEHAASLRPLLKFSTFLLLGNLLSAIGQSTPAIAAYVGSPTTEVNLAINQANGIIILFSIIPTPILVLMYFKPVRDLLKRLFLRVCWNSSQTFLRISEEQQWVTVCQFPPFLRIVNPFGVLLKVCTYIDLNACLVCL